MLHGLGMRCPAGVESGLGMRHPAAIESLGMRRPAGVESGLGMRHPADAAWFGNETSYRYRKWFHTFV